MSRANVKAPLFGSTGAVTAPYFEGAGDLAIGTRSVSPDAFGKRPLSAYAQNFVDQYRAAHGTDRWYGSDAANPQISMAAVVGNAYAVEGLPQIAPNWQAAIDALEQSTIIPRFLHPELIKNFISTKRQELHYLDELSDAEKIELYLDTV
jgi:hypothetical protein